MIQFARPCQGGCGNTTSRQNGCCEQCFRDAMSPKLRACDGCGKNFAPIATPTMPLTTLLLRSKFTTCPACFRTNQPDDELPIKQMAHRVPHNVPHNVPHHAPRHATPEAALRPPHHAVREAHHAVRETAHHAPLRATPENNPASHKELLVADFQAYPAQVISALYDMILRLGEENALLRRTVVTHGKQLATLNDYNEHCQHLDEVRGAVSDLEGRLGFLEMQDVPFDDDADADKDTDANQAPRSARGSTDAQEELPNDNDDGPGSATA